ncbi:protein ZINC INDUCED FACILITATOR-LIKE 1-like [Selaginella moellendorffii]|uniref:protein ZINC INDUCED FACILITATOR-LIKE 1-like n=1 Tax=Selaginella moellendorffii TaxID=88036 RepID=UPI000D1D058F|nr:protein ZINC INDUCED FACILITATOR-LIKE 1-like [Selaginella moellendorffii]|eukprot:XP_024533336.1 protein ZINC INDUCED FACILITATOR-LIKE 1-like [Selaginella moellendorffii]
MGDLELEHSNEKSSFKLATPLPRWELFMIWIIHASQAFQTTMLFPMLVFMVEHYHVGSRSSHTAGQYAGILASLFPLAQFCTSILWGTVSDSTGRKPWLAFGNIVSAVSALLLGLCQRYTSACIVRFVGGLLNGTMTITKSVLGEICDGSNKAKGFGILNLAWGIGSVAGPVLSGLLAQPCSQYGIRSCPRILTSYPFLLPCVAAAIFSTAAVFASLSLRETRPNRVPYVQVNGSKPKEDCHQCVLEMGTDPSIKVTESGDEDESTKFVVIPDGTSDDKNRTVPLLRDRNVLLTSFCYSLTGLIFITTDELFPIFGAASERVGGLGLSSSSLGLILGEGGVVLFLYTLLLYPLVSQKLGPLNCFRLGLITSVPLWLVFPAASLLSHARPAQWTLLAVAMAARSAIACTTFTGVLVLISNSASSGNMGAVMGLSHSLCSFFRAVGPAFGGTIWSYAVRQTFPLHQFLAWLAISIIALFTFSIAMLLPPSLNLPAL